MGLDKKENSETLPCVSGLEHSPSETVALRVCPVTVPRTRHGRWEGGIKGTWMVRLIPGTYAAAGGALPYFWAPSPGPGLTPLPCFCGGLGRYSLSSPCK